MSCFEKSSELIAKCIEEFEEEKITIERLVNITQDIIDNIEKGRKEWVDSFRSEW